MKVGDYVRNNKGEITKVLFMEEKNNWLEVRYSRPLNNITAFHHNMLISKDIEKSEHIIKSNKDILELLEPMDLLYIDIDGGFEGGIVVPRIPETLDELNGFIEFIKSGHWILKGVVTHEQLINRMYKVGE